MKTNNDETICPKIKRHFYTAFQHLTQLCRHFAVSVGFSVTFLAVGHELIASESTNSMAVVAAATTAHGALHECMGIGASNDFNAFADRTLSPCPHRAEILLPLEAGEDQSHLTEMCAQ
ncbi:MAG: hypothetical protein ACLQVG_27095 [Terriglobia bacterium]